MRRMILAMALWAGPWASGATAQQPGRIPAFPPRAPYAGMPAPVLAPSAGFLPPPVFGPSPVYGPPVYGPPAYRPAPGGDWWVGRPGLDLGYDQWRREAERAYGRGDFYLQGFRPRPAPFVDMRPTPHPRPGFYPRGPQPFPNPRVPGR